MQPLDLRTFPYNDGFTDVRGDPFRILRELTVILGGDPNAVLQHARALPPAPSGDPDADRALGDATLVRKAEAQHRLSAAARQAFEMAPYDRVSGRGPLDDECLDVLYSFIDWLKKKGTSGGSPPTSVTPAASPAPWVPGLSPPTPPSASSSTTGDCGCG